MSQEEIINKLNRLTAREREVFEGFCFDLRYWEIGERLHISEDTVAVHMYHITAKLDLPDGLTPFQKKKLLLDEYCTHLVPSLLVPAPPDEEDIEVINEDQLEEAKQLDYPPVVWQGEIGEEPIVDPFRQQEPEPRWRRLVGPAVGLVVGGLVIAALFRFGILGGGGPTPTEEPPAAGDDAVAIAVALTQTQAAIIGVEQQPPTPEPQPEVQEAAEVPPPPAPAVSAFPEILLSEDGIPSGGSMQIQVASGEIHVVTSGPANVAGVFLPGGATRGSVIVLLPNEEPYTLTNLVPTQNWHGAYRASSDQWQIIAEDRATAMHAPGNCTGGAGCETIDVLVVSGNQIIAQYEDVETSAASQSTGPKFVERVGTGLGTYQVYTVTLAADEALAGDATDVEDRGGPCLVFWAQGPRTITFSVYEGAYNIYSGVDTEQDLQEVIDIPYNYLTLQHDFCKTVEVRIFELGS